MAPTPVPPKPIPRKPPRVRLPISSGRPAPPIRARAPVRSPSNPISPRIFLVSSSNPISPRIFSVSSNSPISPRIFSEPPRAVRRRRRVARRGVRAFSPTWAVVVALSLPRGSLALHSRRSPRPRPNHNSSNKIRRNNRRFRVGDFSARARRLNPWGHLAKDCSEASRLNQVAQVSCFEIQRYLFYSFSLKIITSIIIII